MRKKSKQQRGRRRFAKSKLADTSHYDALPYGVNKSEEIRTKVQGRDELKHFFPALIRRGFPPFNFKQTATMLLEEKQKLQNHPDIVKQLSEYQSGPNIVLQLNQREESEFWSENDLPPELLKNAISSCAKYAITKFPVIQRELARLYAVAWFGRGGDSVNAKRQLENLLPSGRANPVTQYIPEIADRFLEIRDWIVQSDKMMTEKFPREAERLKNLSQLYDEPKSVIEAALRLDEKYFVTLRIADVLEISPESVRGVLRKHPLRKPPIVQHDPDQTPDLF